MCDRTLTSGWTARGIKTDGAASLRAGLSLWGCQGMVRLSPPQPFRCTEQFVAVRTYLALRAHMAIERLPRDAQLCAQRTDLRFRLAHGRHRQPQFRRGHLEEGAACPAPARATARPARVRSAINARSNSASAAKIPKTNVPAAVVVSSAAPCPARTVRPMPWEVRSCTVLIRWRRSRPKRRASRRPAHPLGTGP